MQRHCLFALNGSVQTDKPFKSTPKQLAELFRYSHQETLVIHVHGGLVSTRAGAMSARHYYDTAYADAGYPLFLLWEAGPAFSVFPAPPVYSEPNRWSGTGWSPEPEDRGGAHEHPLGARAARFDRVTKDTGRMLWRRIKRYAYNVANPRIKDSAGLELLRAVKPVIEYRKSTGRNTRIVFVAHSAGSLVVANLLERAGEVLPDTKYDIVFLAPAITYSQLHRQLGGFQERVANFRMFALTDEVERADDLGRQELPGRLRKAAYEGSMLYYVSNALEGSRRDSPVLGMQRFYLMGKGEPAERKMTPAEQASFDAVNRVLNLSANTVWTPGLGGPGRNSLTRGHIYFGERETTRSLAHIVRCGFGPECRFGH